MTNTTPAPQLGSYSDAQINALTPAQKTEYKRSLLAAGHSYDAVEARFGRSDTTPQGKEKAEAQSEKTALMKDKGWVRKYMDGDVEARRKMATLDRVISA